VDIVAKDETLRPMAARSRGTQLFSVVSRDGEPQGRLDAAEQCLAVIVQKIDATAQLVRVLGQTSANDLVGSCFELWVWAGVVEDSGIAIADAGIGVACLLLGAFGRQKVAGGLIGKAKAARGTDHAGQLAECARVGIEADELAKRALTVRFFVVFGGEAELIDDLLALGFEVVGIAVEEGLLHVGERAAAFDHAVEGAGSCRWRW
jgi:hypothetical protein